jgi:hypothetical protein
MEKTIFNTFQAPEIVHYSTKRPLYFNQYYSNLPNLPAFFQILKNKFYEMRGLIEYIYLILKVLLKWLLEIPT